ncbi:MAG: hypothetical protein ACJAVK_001284 [Akkermansiaceae bacterium]|jgi:hypothetical protein
MTNHDSQDFSLGGGSEKGRGAGQYATYQSLRVDPSGELVRTGNASFARK